MLRIVPPSFKPVMQQIRSLKLRSSAAIILTPVLFSWRCFKYSRGNILLSIMAAGSCGGYFSFHPSWHISGLLCPSRRRLHHGWKLHSCNSNLVEGWLIFKLFCLVCLLYWSPLPYMFVSSFLCCICWFTSFASINGIYCKCKYVTDLSNTNTRILQEICLAAHHNYHSLLTLTAMYIYFMRNLSCSPL